LVAGQLTKFFYLENTGRTGVLGIKLKPTALSKLFGLSMKAYTDKVISANNLSDDLDKIKQILSKEQHYESMIKGLNEFIGTLTTTEPLKANSIDEAVEIIFERKGMVSIEELAASIFVSERQFLNQFKQQVGLSPKFFARIIRLNYIFQLVKENKEKWSSLAYEAAYFDQSHFIKDFKAFTGENPNRYSFDEKNLANFFLLKKDDIY
jgi:AraC-like DNA-binding protein